MSDYESVKVLFNRARKIRADIGELHSEAIRANQLQLAEIVRDGGRGFDEKLFVQLETKISSENKDA